MGKMLPDIDRPIFIVGPHRSGTTVCYTLLAAHPDVGYPNFWNHRLPRTPGLAHWRTRLSGRDEPREAQWLWDYHWSSEDDVMDARDVTPEVTLWYRNRVARILALRGASRFVAKYPRLSFRLGWLNRVFPGALFVHVVRDWRAVVSSTTERKRQRDKHSSTTGRKSQRDKYSGSWFGVRAPGWKAMPDLPHEIAAGKQYRLATEAIESSAKRLPGRVFRVQYAELCENPARVLHDLFDQLGLDWSDAFAAGVPAKLDDANHKWREQLDPDCIARIRSEAPEFFARFEE